MNGGPTGCVVALLGATAAGKTAAAVAIAQRLPVEVVSADSRQIRREMLIGTAAPTAEEMAAVPHHLVGIVEPDAPWTVQDFRRRALEAIEDIRSRGKLPLLLGGTGQYVWALLEGWQVPEVPPNQALRAELTRLAEEQGREALRDRLAEVDPQSAERIGYRNVRRVVRAIEVFEATGAPVPPLRKESPPFPWRALGMAWPRRALYARADARAGRMYAAGLVGETRALIEQYGADFDALRAIGYAEAARVVAGEWDEPLALARTKRNTHRLIRKQHTWFRPQDRRIAWVDGRDTEAIVAAVEHAFDETAPSPDTDTAAAPATTPATAIATDAATAEPQHAPTGATDIATAEPKTRRPAPPTGAAAG